MAETASRPVPPIARARPSRRIIAEPWTLQEVDDGHDFPAITTLTTWGTLDLPSCGLTPGAYRRMAAIHEAGHAVLFHRAGYTITEMALYPDDTHAPEPWQRPGTGHTRPGAPAPGTVLVPDRVIEALLAGQVASEIWLQREGLLTERSRLLTYSLAAGDHERLLTDIGGAVFVYGNAPGVGGADSFSIDELTGSTRRALGERWETVALIAGLLDVRCRLADTDLAGLLGNTEVRHG